MEQITASRTGDGQFWEQNHSRLVLFSDFQTTDHFFDIVFRVGNDQFRRNCSHPDHSQCIHGNISFVLILDSTFIIAQTEGIQKENFGN